MKRRMIKADLKHWAGRRGEKGPLETNYSRFAKQARTKLGEGGVVGIPNARGPDHDSGAEYRFEEFYGLAKKSGHQIKKLGDGRVFHDKDYNIWFVKSQEVNSEYNEKKLTYLVFNIPLNKNFNEENNEALRENTTINVLTLPSCIEQIGIFDRYSFTPPVLQDFNGIITHSSSTTILGDVNKRAQEFYNEVIKGHYFGAPFHKIGAIAVSGGHRVPKETLIQKIVSPVSVGSSYTLFPKFNGGDLYDFNKWLKNSIENSQYTSKLVKGSIKREMMFRHLPRMIQGVLSGERKTIL